MWVPWHLVTLLLPQAAADFLSDEQRQRVVREEAVAAAKTYSRLALVWGFRAAQVGWLAANPKADGCILSLTPLWPTDR